MALAFAGGDAIVPSIRDAAIAEAARIWLPYGVAVELDIAPCAADAIHLTVNPTRSRARGDGPGALGTIHFGHNGLPDPTITIRYDTVERIAADVGVLGTDIRLMPRRPHHEAVGRVLGRALAHELGHYLLRSPSHTREGLMRDYQRASAFTARGAGPFVLSDLEIARLRVAVPAWLAQAGCAAATTLRATPEPASRDRGAPQSPAAP